MLISSAVSYLTWKDILTLLSFLGSVALLGWWLSRQFGFVRESLVRIEEREKSTQANLEHVKGQNAQLQADLTNVRERVIILENRQPPTTPQNGAPLP